MGWLWIWMFHSLPTISAMAGRTSWFVVQDDRTPIDPYQSQHNPRNSPQGPACVYGNAICDSKSKLSNEACVTCHLFSIFQVSINDNTWCLTEDTWNSFITNTHGLMHGNQWTKDFYIERGPITNILNVFGLSLAPAMIARGLILLRYAAAPPMASELGRKRICSWNTD